MTPRPERPRRSRGVLLAGLGGFVLGAATVLLIVWLYGGGVGPGPAVTGPPPGMEPGGTAAPPVTQTVPPPAPLPAAPPVGATHTPEPAPAPPSSAAAEPADLARRDLLVPVQGVARKDLRDTFTEARGQGRTHEAIDILAPRNTPVVAVEDGRVVKLFNSAQGGLTVYQFDPTETYAYYYAHLERYAQGLKEEDVLHRGQVLGYVGTSGNAPKNTPHLHFAIFKLGPERNWWQGAPLNPFPYLHGDTGAATILPTR